MFSARCLKVSFELVGFHTFSRHDVTTQQTFRLLLVAFSDWRKLSLDFLCLFGVFVSVPLGTVFMGPDRRRKGIFPYWLQVCVGNWSSGHCAVTWLCPSINFQQLRYFYMLHFVWARFVYINVAIFLWVFFFFINHQAFQMTPLNYKRPQGWKNTALPHLIIFVALMAIGTNFEGIKTVATA